MGQDTVDAYVRTSVQFRLGSVGPIAVGVATDQASNPLSVLIREARIQFDKFILTVGLPMGIYDVLQDPPVLPAGLAPQGRALIVDVQKSLDGGVTYNSLFNGNMALMPTLNPGIFRQETYNQSGAFGEIGGNYPAVAGNLLRVYIEQIGNVVAGENIVLECDGRVFSS
jgi:hypothetical protein